MNDYGKPHNDKTQHDEQTHDLIDQLNLLEAVDRRITPEHVTRRFRELLDDIGNDGTATAERLRRVLNQPDRSTQLTGLKPKYDAESCVDPIDLIGSMEAAIAAARGAAADIIADAQLKAKASIDELRRAQVAVTAARQQAEQIVTDARTEADKALDLAAKMVRDAQDQAEQILSEAHNEAEQIVTAARNQQARQAAWTGHGGALEARGFERTVSCLAAGGGFDGAGFDPDQGEGGIAFAYEQGRRQHVAASALAKLLSMADPRARLLIVDNCRAAASADTDVFSNMAVTWLNNVPEVTSMQSAVTGVAAVAFSRAFYQTLEHNRGIDDAIRAGQIALTGVGAVGTARLWNLASGGLDGTVRLWNLRALAEFADQTASTRLTGLLTRHGSLDRLRARADAKDVYAVMQLARLLAERNELDELLRVLAETAGPDAIAEFARRQVSDFAPCAPAVATDDLTSRVQALAGALATYGYAASAAPAPAKLPQQYEAETEAFGRLLGMPVQRLAKIAHLPDSSAQLSGSASEGADGDDQRCPVS